MFQQQMRENANKSSSIELKESEAKLFPCLLDYIYLNSERDIHDLTYEEIFEFYQLAEYFLMPELQKTVAPKVASPGLFPWKT